MPDPPSLPNTPNPIERLRAGVEAHKAVISAAKQTGQEIAVERQTPPAAGSVPEA